MSKISTPPASPRVCPKSIKEMITQTCKIHVPAAIQNSGLECERIIPLPARTAKSSSSTISINLFNLFYFTVKIFAIFFILYILYVALKVRMGMFIG
jgi:hypothetical protein